MREKTEPDMIYELLQMFQCQKGSLITFFFVLLFWAKRKVFQKMLYCRNYDEVFFFFSFLPSARVTDSVYASAFFFRS